MDIYMILFIVTFLILILISALYIKVKDEVAMYKLKYAVLNTRYTQEIKSAQERYETLQNAREELNKEFKLLANQIFEDKSKKFNHEYKEQFEILLKPFREQINSFSAQSREQYKEEIKDRHFLKNELIRLKEMNAQLSTDALNLTNALRGENKTQGNWGEMILERILEESGLRRGIEFKIQSSLKSKDGKTYRPDVVIHMPKNRDIVIDSKVSLVAYEKFIAQDDEEKKATALKEHLNSINTHIKELSNKSYEQLEGVNSLDFVLLFMPIEGAFLLALQEDDEFFKKAYERNIMVVSPSTLLVTLRTIEHIWRTQKQQEHSLRIASEAEAMYDKLVGFVDEMKKIGVHLQKAQESYSTSMDRLKTGRGNLIKRAENIVSLGIKPKKSLDIKSEE